MSYIFMALTIWNFALFIRVVYDFATTIFILLAFIPTHLSVYRHPHFKGFTLPSQLYVTSSDFHRSRISSLCCRTPLVLCPSFNTILISLYTRRALLPI